MRARSALPVLLCALLASCSAPVEPVSGGFVGDWATERKALSPAGTHDDLLSLGADGRFVAESRMYGAYPGQPAGQLSASSRTEGSYRAEDGRLHFQPESLTTFDTFEGKPKTTVHRPYPYGGVYEGAEFDVDGDRLTLPRTPPGRLRRAPDPRRRPRVHRSCPESFLGPTPFTGGSPMRLRALALPLLVLAALPGAALAQAATDPPKEIRVTSATPGQDVYFRVQMESSLEADGGTIELVGASAFSKEGEDVRVRTPATLRILSEGPFRVTLASVPGEGRIQVVRIGGDREVTASGDVLTLAREEHGGGVLLLRAKEMHVRLLDKPASR